jgi:uncharacterized protein YceK
MNTAYKILFIVFTIITLTSCHSTTAYGFGADESFAGTKMIFSDLDSEKIEDHEPDSENESNTGTIIFRTVDFPFTFIADIILYPVMKTEQFFTEDDLNKCKCNSEKNENINKKLEPENGADT